MSPAPLAVPDHGVGPAPRPGRLDELAPGLWRLTARNPGLMTGPGTNTYLVGHGRLAVIDPGPDDPAHRAALVAAVAGLGAEVGWVLVTHTHPDHAPGAAALAAATGAETLGYGPADGFTPDRVVGEGFVLDGPGVPLRALHTPGHASNHLCFLADGLFEEGPVLCSGDHVMHGSTVVIRPPDGDLAADRASLERLLALEPPLGAVAPGHGRLITDPAPVIRATLAHRAERSAAVAAALAAAKEATVEELVAVVYDDVSEERQVVAQSSLWACLRDLAAAGRAEPPAPVSAAGKDRDGPWRATATTAA
ncbi:MAG TPA: MBL fold metallo-hydrolase [Acidimicrobiales bacterium]|nr:MBL fold metallo-hydrolase [Acidimicrobiales bacterium]